jgi:signal transduction histidine kinase
LWGTSPRSAWRRFAWLAAHAVFIDAEGRPLTPPELGSGPLDDVLEREGQPVAALVHDPAVLEDPGLLEAVASAAQLAAANAQLRADVQARVEELAASRRRVLQARDEGRGRLERRLRDGAEARLGALAVTLRRGQQTATNQQTSDQIVGAQQQLVRTLEELRRLAQGLHPRELSEHGLEGALAALAEDFLLPVEVKVTRTQLPERVAAAAYFICAEALTNTAKHAAAAHVAIAVTVSGGRVRVEIADDGVGGADLARGSGLRGLTDRVEAFGGTLPVESAPGHGTRLVAEIPLGDKATWR